MIELNGDIGIFSLAGMQKSSFFWNNGKSQLHISQSDEELLSHK